MIMKKSILKSFIKKVLLEVRRSGGRGEWVDPNGKVYDVGDTTHLEWAEKYVGNDRHFSQNPYLELLSRGWIRILFNYIDSLMVISRHKELTRKQKEYVEDQAERTRWAIFDDLDGEVIYKPYNCITPDKHLDEIAHKDIKSNYPPRYAFDKDWNPNLSMMTLDNLKSLKQKAERNITYCRSRGMSVELKRELKIWRIYDLEMRRRMKYINSPVNEDHGLGYSHNVSFDITKKERDPLTDPLLTGKMNETKIKFKYKDHDWLALASGFRKPTDVFYGTILLGVIESVPDGYVILTVDSPKGMTAIKKSPQNHFKTKDDAAKTLHQTWKMLRIEK